jgi:teichoic acid transport system ATP-binding protein
MGMDNDEIKAIEDTIVEFAELGEYIDQPVRTYSSGMKARLGFAINVNIDPEILIVDEALSVGDKNFRKKCTNKMRDIMHHEDVTLLFVTHSLETAKEFCTRGIVLEKGTLKFDGPIQEAIDYYEGKY